MKVLFVCSGNICRSPMAAEYFRHRASQQGLAHVVVDSAGTLGFDGAPASATAIAVLGECGLDLATHRSRGLTPIDLWTSDLVVAMAEEHLVELAAAEPQGSARRLLLRAFEKGAEPASAAPDLADPIAQGIEVYRERFATIRTCVDHLVLYLRHLSPEFDGG